MKDIMENKISHIVLIFFLLLGFYISFSGVLTRESTPYDKYYDKDQYQKDWREWMKNDPVNKWWWKK